MKVNFPSSSSFTQSCFANSLMGEISHAFRMSLAVQSIANLGNSVQLIRVETVPQVRRVQGYSMIAAFRSHVRLDVQLLVLSRWYPLLVGEWLQLRSAQNADATSGKTYPPWQNNRSPRRYLQGTPLREQTPSMEKFK
jgi:hypothetical protein